MNKKVVKEHMKFEFIVFPVLFMYVTSVFNYTMYIYVYIYKCMHSVRMFVCFCVR